MHSSALLAALALLTPGGPAGPRSPGTGDQVVLRMPGKPGERPRGLLAAVNRHVYEIYWDSLDGAGEDGDDVFAMWARGEVFPIDANTPAVLVERPRAEDYPPTALVKLLEGTLAGETVAVPAEAVARP